LMEGGGRGGHPTHNDSILLVAIFYPLSRK